MTKAIGSSTGGTETEMTSHASKVGKQFGTVAEAYLSSTVHSRGADLEAITAKLRDQSGARVLDLGCGAGHLSFAVAPQVEAVVAYDLSTEMIDIVNNEAKRRDLRNVFTKEGQAELQKLGEEIKKVDEELKKDYIIKEMPNSFIDKYKSLLE